MGRGGTGGLVPYKGGYGRVWDPPVRIIPREGTPGGRSLRIGVFRSRFAGFKCGTRPTAEHSHLLPPIPHAGRKQLPPWETVVMMLGAERAVLVSPTNRFPHAKVCRVQMRNPAYGCSFSLKLCQVDDVGIDDATSLCFIDLVFSIFHDDLTIRVKEFVLLDHQAIV